MNKRRISLKEKKGLENQFNSILKLMEQNVKLTRK